MYTTEGHKRKRQVPSEIQAFMETKHKSHARRGTNMSPIFCSAGRPNYLHANMYQ